MTGPSVDQAKDLALDELGVDETDAEFEVLEEPRTGLFGRTRGEAKVRARVRPSTPRPKHERRERRGRGQGGGRGRGGRNRRGRGGGSGGGGGGGDRERSAGNGDGGDAAKGQQRGDQRGGSSKGRSRGGRSGGGRGEERRHDDRQEDRKRPAAAAATEGNEEKKMTEAMPAAEQGEIVKEFLEGLLDAFGVDGDVDADVVDDDVVEIAADGSDLGLLIGPRGATLDAVQELARRSLQRQVEDTGDVRVRVDVGGYRQRRREALDRFARDAAAKVLDTGNRLALEPMSAADRKVVHDAINEVDGVSTISEGEDQRRRVVLVPEGDDD